MVLILAGSLELDETLFELRRDGRAVALEPQAFDVLVHLVRHHDRVVAKEELMDVVWRGRFVTETAVTSRIKQVRRALGDDGQAQRMVRTVHGRGYRFVGDVSRAEAPAAPLPVERPPVRYTVSDGLHIAYQVTGGGDRDIVLIPGFVSHLDLDWDDPRHAHFLDRLGTMGRLVRFDKRGTGMSDRPIGVPDLETRMHDVLAVMDAVDSERAVLCGYSEGGPMAVLLAAMHPERVSSLVLYGSYARRTWAADYPWGWTAEARAERIERLVTTWDWEADLLMRCPSADRAMQEWWSRRMRAAATPGTVRALMQMNTLVDVRSLLPRVTVPTLVVNRVGDALCHPEEAAYIAERVPGATLRLLEGSDHLVAGDPDQILDAIEPFIAASTAAPQHRALAAVAAPTGPANPAVCEALVAAGGRARLSRSGDRLVLFDGPATAVRAALQVLGAHPDAGIGLSVAEVAIDGGPVTGAQVESAVHLGAAARPATVLVTGTAAVLLAGSGVELAATSDPDVLRVVHQ
ncbi:alpha/beta fold hydrolase [Nocardioides sp. MAHUQ-72]|uniref:alpha/beta fold hydrolase n=1 Tax=unclassified Nocardioides TaxID=2615069 RepID=UPI00361FFED8